VSTTTASHLTLFSVLLTAALATYFCTACSDPETKKPVEIPDIVVFPGAPDQEAGAVDASVEAGPLEAGGADAAASRVDAAATNAAPSSTSSSAPLTGTYSPTDYSVTRSEDAAPVSYCGDGVLDHGEECDDGNRLVTDGCVQCTIVPVCGNERLEFSEQCDDGNTVATDGCAGCVLVPLCGNGLVETGEECDSPDITKCNRCRLPKTHVCGNGIIDVGEECDSTSEACVACRLIAPICGDGIPNSDEQCDDANDFDNDGCDRLCRVRQCGDNVVQDGEHCDPPGGTCRSDCTLLPPNCGDGTLQPSERETCDDGNLTVGDGCNACDFECGNGLVEPTLGELCEPRSASRSCRASIAPECVQCVNATDCETRDACDDACRPVPVCSIVDTHADAGVSSLDPTLDCLETPPAPVCPTAINLLPNSSFDATTDGWSAADPRVTLYQTAADGFAAPGAMLVVLDNGGIGGLNETRGAQACLSAKAGAAYTFRGAYRFLDATWQASGVSVSLFQYNSANCSGAPVSPEVSRGSKAPIETDWTGYSFTVNTAGLSADGPVSILVKLDVWRSPELSAASVLWDDVSVVEDETQACTPTSDAGL
jgi:cysteine-rich repeat protein